MPALIARIQHITQDLPLLSHAEQAERACRGGIRWIQFRTKTMTGSRLIEEAKKVQVVCRRYGAVFVVNDFVELAAELEADGLHLGKEDMPLEKARDTVGHGMILGATSNTMEDVVKAAHAGAGYTGLGPFRNTTTKLKLSPVLGEKGVKAIIDSLKKKNMVLPVIVIGGIRPEDVPGIMHSGAHGIAVAGAINRAVDPVLASRGFVSVGNNLVAAV